MNHVRPHAAATADLRDAGAARARRHASRPAPSTTSRTPPRCAASRSRSGRYNIPNVGIFLWRVAGAAARALAARRRRRVRPALPLRPARHRQAALRRAAHRAGDHAPRRAARRAAAAAAPVRSGAHLAELLRRRAARCCSRPRPPPASTPIPSTDIRVCDLSDDPARPAPGRTSRSRPTRTSRSTRCSAASRSPPRRPPARRGSRRSTTARRSRSAAAATTAPASLERGRHGRAASTAASRSAPPLASVAGGGAVQILDSRRYAAPATITATTPGAERRRPGARRCAPPTARARCSRAPTSCRLAMEPDTTVVLDGLCSPARRS